MPMYKRPLKDILNIQNNIAVKKFKPLPIVDTSDASKMSNVVIEAAQDGPPPVDLSVMSPPPDMEIATPTEVTTIAKPVNFRKRLSAIVRPINNVLKKKKRKTSYCCPTAKRCTSVLFPIS